MNVIHGAQVPNGDANLAAWAAERVAYLGPEGFGPCRASGVLDANNDLLCVVVYHAWDERCGTAQISIAAQSPRWARHDTITKLLAVPFEQFGCRKVWSLVASDNERSLKLCKGLGFRQEGVLRHQFADGIHATFLGLRVAEYRALWPGGGIRKVLARKRVAHG